MRIGLIAAIIFMVTVLGVMYGVVQNQSMVTEEVKEHLDATSDLQVEVQDIGWGSVLTLPVQTFNYFKSLMKVVWQVFNNPFTEGGWTMVSYILLSPLIAVVVLGLVMMVIAIVQKAT